MGTITGFTAAREQAIEDSSVVSGAVNGSGHLMLTKHDGSQVDAGYVVGPQGIQGPQGNALNAWPVGSLFFSTVATNPNTLLGGGTWVAWGTGRVPVAIDTAQTEFNTVEKTGGAKTHDHTVQPHSHTQGSLAARIRLSTGDNLIESQTATMTAYSTDTQMTAASHAAVSGSRTNGVNVVGTTDPATVDTDPAVSLPPYITCYIWKRTA